MKWVQLPGTTLPWGEIHTNFSNLIFPFCAWPWWTVQQEDRSMEVRVTECIQQTTAGISKHYWRQRTKSCLPQGFCDVFLERELKTRLPFPDLSSHLTMQVSEKQMLVLGVVDSVLTEFGSIWGRKSHVETNSKS